MADQGKKLKYVGNASISETFCDAVAGVGFDGSNIRIELAVTRIAQGPEGREETVHPVARLVMPLNSVNELMSKLGGALADLEKQGVVRKTAGGEKAKN
jgi:hypothetical protein